MTIQIPNPGTGNGASGDNEFVLWSKVKDNFSDQTNAASRLVGTANGNLVEVAGEYGVGGTGLGGFRLRGYKSSATFRVNTQFFDSAGLGGDPIPPAWGDTSQGIGGWIVNRGGRPVAFFFGNRSELKISHRATDAESSWTPAVTVYTTANTTKDVATGFIKASSPVLHVYNDSITKIHEAEQLDITVDKKGVGHYEIHGTTGLRKNDGWFMSPPRDMHSNVLCMVDYEEKDGVIILKTYKKKFDFETVSIVHDYDNPMDIPEGSCVEFRFNDLPQENLDDIQPEV